jgi:hypothetical protein
MKLHSAKVVWKLVLSAGFLAIVLPIAGTLFEQAVRVINEMPLGEKTINGQFFFAKEELSALYANMFTFKGSPLVNKGTYIELNGLMARLMGQRRMNGIVKLKNGYLTDEGTWGIQPKFNTSPYLSGIKMLADICKSRNIAFLYVLPPIKIYKYDKQMPEGVSDFSNENIDEFVSLVRGSGIETLDLREALHTGGLDHYQAFFKTDHHWKPETGFWAANKIRSYFADKGLLNTDAVISDLLNYNVDVYANIFMGSAARRTGVNWGGIDNISLIYPKFDTNIRVSGNGLDKTGSFKDVMFDMSNMAAGFEKNTYSVYPSFYKQFIHFENKAAKNKQTVLFLSDSFGMVCAPFLSLDVENLFFGYGAYNDIMSALNSNKPNIVLTSINIGHLQALTDALKDYADN